ncbi:MAG: tetratricopeptide repeat protein [Candidatus Omnitrophota bacterium]|nr:tetratricopeptide repeat protein [Candidatus Omnitrophota bacterium]
MSTQDAVFANRKSVLLICAGIVCLGVIIYANTFQSSFHLDDFRRITRNTAVHDFSDSSAIWEAHKQRFFTYWTFALNHHFHGDDVLGYHLANTGIHIAAALAVFFLVCLLYRTPAMKERFSEDEGKLLALFSALIFLCHPLQTQAVTYVIQRLASLSGLCYLIVVLFYLRGRLTGEWWNFAVALAAGILAVFSKESTYTLPFAIILCEVFFFKGGSYSKRTALAALLFIPVIVVYFAAFHDRFASGGIAAATSLGEALPRGQYLLTQINVLRTYIRLLFVPLGQSVDYDYPSTTSLANVPTLFSLAFLLGWAAAAVIVYRKHRILSFGIAWFFLALSVESSVIPIEDIIFEHRLYLPLFGFALAIPYGAGLILKRRQDLVVLLSIIVALLALLTFARNRVWKDEISLWKDTTQKSPGNARAFMNLGNAYMQRKMFDKAIPVTARAVELDPDDIYARINHGMAYEMMGRLDEALAVYQGARAVDRDTGIPDMNIAMVHYSRKEYDKAMASIEGAIKINPDNYRFYVNSAVIYRDVGDHERSVRDLEKVLALNPRFGGIHYRLGAAYEKVGRLDDANREYKKAHEADPRNEEALKGWLRVKGSGTSEPAAATGSTASGTAPAPGWQPTTARDFNDLGIAMTQQGDMGKAVTYIQKAIELDTNVADYHYNLGAVYGRLLKFDEAAASFTRALEANPEHYQSLVGMGLSAYKDRRFGEAEEWYKRAIAAHPAVGQTYYNLGLVYAKEGLYEKAVTAFRDAIDKGENAAGIYDVLAQSYLNLHRTEEAQAALMESLSLDPEHVATHYYLGLAYAQSGEETKVHDKVSVLEEKGQADLAERLRNYNAQFGGKGS